MEYPQATNLFKINGRSGQPQYITSGSGFGITIQKTGVFSSLQQIIRLSIGRPACQSDYADKLRLTEFIFKLFTGKSIAEICAMNHQDFIDFFNADPRFQILALPRASTELRFWAQERARFRSGFDMSALTEEAHQIIQDQYNDSSSRSHILSLIFDGMRGLLDGYNALMDPHAALLQRQFRNDLSAAEAEELESSKRRLSSYLGGDSSQVDLTEFTGLENLATSFDDATDILLFQDDRNVNALTLLGIPMKTQCLRHVLPFKNVKSLILYLRMKKLIELNLGWSRPMDSRFITDLLGNAGSLYVIGYDGPNSYRVVSTFTTPAQIDAECESHVGVFYRHFVSIRGR